VRLGRSDNEHPRRHQSRRHGSLHAELVVMLHRPGRDVVGE
jgi:hypothetical protein